MAIPFVSGAIVVLYLQGPREKVWGVLQDLGPAGVSLRGLDLSSFDDWLRGMSSGEDSILPSTAFYPLARVEKILLDEASDGVPSLDDLCRERTGTGLRALVEGGRGQVQKGGAP